MKVEELKAGILRMSREEVQKLLLDIRNSRRKRKEVAKSKPTNLRKPTKPKM